MRVICIDDKNQRYSPKVREGETYVVIGNATGISGIQGYILEGLDKDGGIFYCWRFIPTSDIDEAEFERDYNKELQPK